MTVAAIGLGANLGNPAAQIEQAILHLAGIRQCTLLARSRLYRSAAIGPEGQPDYCNAAALIDTDLEPLELLSALQGIETACGRQRAGPRWGARILDLDLLFFGELISAHPHLTLPHPELARRNFVLTPLAEIASAVSIPGLGVVADLAAALPQNGLRLWQ